MRSKRAVPRGETRLHRGRFYTVSEVRSRRRWPVATRAQRTRGTIPIGEGADPLKGELERAPELSRLLDGQDQAIDRCGVDLSQKLERNVKLLRRGPPRL